MSEEVKEVKDVCKHWNPNSRICLICGVKKVKKVKDANNVDKVEVTFKGDSGKVE